MTMNVTIKIIGDALVYEKKDLWNIVFVTDQAHVANLFVDDSTTAVQSFRSPAVNRHLVMIADNPVDATRLRGPAFDNILNISGPKLHSTDASGRSNLTTRPNPANGRELIYMSIPIGTVDGSDFVEDYWYEEYPASNPPDNSKHGSIGLKTAQTVNVTFKLNRGTGLGLVVSDENGAEQISWPYKKGPLELLFDNSCHNIHGGREDFLHYYDWVTDIRPGNRRFITGKMYTRKNDKGEVYRSPEGNCDPVDIFPPPLP